MTMPSLANEPAIIAIWSGVTLSSYCPIELRASWASSISEAIDDGVTESGICIFVPNPYSSAFFFRASSPSWTPSIANEVLQLCWSADCKLDTSFGPHGEVSPFGWFDIDVDEFGS